MPRLIPAGLRLAAAWLFVCLASFSALAAPEPVAQRIARFNQLLPRHGYPDPVQIALLWSGSPKGKERTIVYRAGSGENPQTATVLLSEEGLPDDSLAGSRTSFSFAKVKGRWTLTGISEAWRCRRGPNTKAYVTGVCP